MTHMELFATLAPRHVPGPHGTQEPWTREECLALLDAYVAESGAVPTRDDMAAQWGFPCYAVISKLFGGMPRYTAHATLPPPPVVQRERVECLRCHRDWRSPDRVRRRICPTCQAHPPEDDGAWMTGSLIREETVADWLELDFATGR